MSRINLSMGMSCVVMWAGHILMFTITSDRGNIPNGLTECQKISVHEISALCSFPAPRIHHREGNQAFAYLYTGRVPDF